MKKVALYTLGCRVNQYETEGIAEKFIKSGYEVVDFDNYADVYVINTCTVTSISDKKSRKMLRKAKKINTESVIVAAGCYAQVSPNEIAQIDEVDIIVGTDEKGKIPQLVEDFIRDRKKIKHIDNIMSIREFEELEIDEYQDKTRGFLKIQDGCDRFCSYCMIPYARGPVRSRKPDNVMKEIRKLASNGYKEIILSGIHVASYGKDLGNIGLSDIIEMASKIDGIERIRIGSVDPMFFSNDVIKKLGNINKFCPHFHLSLQSGCDETLIRMNRRYTTREYEDVINKLRGTFTDVSITTDIIVGFPGETDEEFDTTYKFLERIKLSKMHIFKYSPRKGTKAAEIEDHITPEIKEKRSSALIKLDEKLEREFIEKYIGKTVDVLFEEGNNDTYNGYTKNYLRVQTNSDKDIRGDIIKAKLVQNKGNLAIGNI